MWATIGPTVDELPWLYELVHRRLVKALLCWSSQPLSPQHTISPSIRQHRNWLGSRPSRPMGSGSSSRCPCAWWAGCPRDRAAPWA